MALDKSNLPTETFKVQADDGKIVEVTGYILARERKPEQPVQAEPPQQ